MNCNCERIRRRALEHGEGSVEYAVWVRHSQHCEECRSEVYIQSLLRRDTGSEGAGLSSEAVSRLVHLADERYRGGRRRHERLMRQLVGWGARAAVFVLLLYGLALLHPRLFEVVEDRPSGGAVASSTPALAASGLASVSSGKSPEGSATSRAGKAVDSSSSTPAELGGAVQSQMVLGRSDMCLSDVLDARESLERARAYSHEPEVLPGWSFERKLQSCRERIGVQRESLYESLDDDTWLDFSR